MKKVGVWEDALNQFLSGWLKKSEVVGVLVCGSYVTGSPSEHSDIDVHIILADTVKWRERGDVFVNGYLVEYFANPFRSIKGYFEEDFKEGSYQAPIMFVTGRVLLDKNGVVRKLQKLARTYLKKRFKSMGLVACELKKYSLWDNLDNFEDAFTRKINIPYLYFNYLRQVYEAYSYYLHYPASSVDKTERLLSDPVIRKKYLLTDFPDKKFAQLFLSSLSVEGPKKMLKHLNQLTSYVLIRMGGFSVDGWKVRSACNP
ncbi:MAG: nucleotidyltransferase domain-containing protein [Nanoarchaeota archaeon]|nr:nucleotidyltransferase domain-containing protein [Nanoarchaeota archaeon]